MKRALFLALLGLTSVFSSVSGQSLLGSQGLGMPVDPMDARARALGTVGVGLFGPSLTPVDIAAAARIYLPTAQITLQPQWVDVSFADQSATTQGTRFPQLGLAYPVPSLNGTAVLHISSFFDQRWEVQQASTQDLDGGPVSVTDVFKSDGGISTVRFGWAHRLGDDLSIGVGVGSRVGSVTRRFTRLVNTEEVLGVAPFGIGGTWQYSGLTAALGFQWDPIRALRLGGTVDWSGELKADPETGTEGGSVRFEIPTEFRLGASGILTPRLALLVGMSFSDWKASNEFLGSEAVAGSVWSFGGGLEWAGPQMGARNFPIRIGARKSNLPFTFEGENPTENVLTGGIGLNLVPPQTGLVGAIDVAFEKGSRDAGSLSESFWRASLTFRVGSF
jgi:hypothetical protein